MHFLLNSPLFAQFTFSLAQAAIIIIPVTAIVVGGIIVVGGMYFHHRQKELWHETARLALEKGQPLPPISTEDDSSKDELSEGANDVRSGLICIAVGWGLYLFLGNFVSNGLGYVGAIPGFVGVVLLVFGLFRLLSQRKQSPRE